MIADEWSCGTIVMSREVDASTRHDMRIEPGTRIRVPMRLPACTASRISVRLFSFPSEGAWTGAAASEPIRCEGQ